MLGAATRRYGVLGLASCAVAVLVGGGALHGDLLLSRSFDRALDDMRSGLSFSATEPGTAARRSAVGDEGFWLTRAEVGTPAPLTKPLLVGDRITISGRDGRERQLEVIDLKPIGEVLTRVHTGSEPIRLLLVTCRVLSGDSQDPVRFIVEGSMPDTPALPRATPAKAL